LFISESGVPTQKGISVHCEEEKCTVVLVVLQLKKKNAVVYIDRIQYLLELVPDPKKGEVRLPPTLNGAGGIYK